MNILIVIGHPDKNSFNHAIAKSCVSKLQKNGHKVVFHDLYDEKFNPLMNKLEIPIDGQIDNIVKQHCDDLLNSDGIIIIHPNWWGQPPAIMKGWIDRIIRPGVAYKFLDGDNGEGIPLGLLKAQVGIVFNTSNTSESRENNVFLDPLETIWKNCIFKLCGINQFYRRMFRIIINSDIEQRHRWLNEVEAVMDDYFPKTNNYGCYHRV